MKEFNLVLLEKWCWKKKNSLWHWVLVSHYKEGGGRLCYDGGVGSVWWRNFNLILEDEGVSLGEANWIADNM